MSAHNKNYETIAWLRNDGQNYRVTRCMYELLLSDIREPIEDILNDATVRQERPIHLETNENWRDAAVSFKWAFDVYYAADLSSTQPTYFLTQPNYLQPPEVSSTQPTYFQLIKVASTQPTYFQLSQPISTPCSSLMDKNLVLNQLIDCKICWYERTLVLHYQRSVGLWGFVDGWSKALD